MTNLALVKLHIAVLIAGLTGVLGRIIEADAFVLSLYRTGMALICIFVLLKFLKAIALPQGRMMVRYMLVGALLVVHWIFFYGSIKLSNISIGVVCLSTGGFFTAILEPLLLKSKFSFKEIFFALLSILGIALIFNFDAQYRLGITVGIIASFLAALYTVTSKQISSTFETKNIFMYQMAGAFIMMSALTPVYAYFNDASNLIVSLDDFYALLFLVIVCTLGLYLLQLDVARHISAFTINLSFNLEPLYSIIIAIVFFNESKDLNFSFAIGLILIITSVVLQSIRTVRMQRALNAKRQKEAAVDKA